MTDGGDDDGPVLLDRERVEVTWGGDEAVPAATPQRMASSKVEPRSMAQVNAAASASPAPIGHTASTRGGSASTMDFPLDLDIAAEPVVSSDYRARLQSPTVEVMRLLRSSQ